MGNQIDTARVFAKPVFILAAPRSGSTLLFETLAKCESLWTIGGESHGVFEGITALRPGSPGVSSNRLGCADATNEVSRELRDRFIQLLHDREGRMFATQPTSPIRMLEKTPKNSLRVPFLNAIFTDALFVYLYREPRANISSIMEAWRSGRYITYRNLPGWDGPWSLLLPPGWQRQRGRGLARTAAFQWEAANRCILDDLADLPASRWTVLSYEQFIDAPQDAIRGLCEFAGVTLDPVLERATADTLPLSRYTLTAPSREKWRKNEIEVMSVLPDVLSTYERARCAEATGVIEKEVDAVEELAAPEVRLGRNTPCPCGSGKKYKRCHGAGLA